VIFILLADQLIFACMDLAMGVMVDRVSRAVGKLGRLIVAPDTPSAANP
jgi:hypothetical protein